MRSGVKVEWRHCFWVAAELSPSRGWQPSLDDVQALLSLVSFPQARMLRSLRVNLPLIVSNPLEAADLATQLIRVLPPTIQHLELGHVFPNISHVELKQRFPHWDGLPISDDSAYRVRRLSPTQRDTA
jgi:hypothetical protein